MFGAILPQGDILQREDSVDGVSTPVSGVHSYHGNHHHDIHRHGIHRHGTTMLFLHCASIGFKLTVHM